jgi:hypothetical protein
VLSPPLFKVAPIDDALEGHMLPNLDLRQHSTLGPRGRHTFDRCHTLMFKNLVRSTPSSMVPEFLTGKVSQSWHYSKQDPTP